MIPTELEQIQLILKKIQRQPNAPLALKYSSFRLRDLRTTTKKTVKLPEIEFAAYNQTDAKESTSTSFVAFCSINYTRKKTQV